MLVRIVKMSFKPENIASFEQVFQMNKHKIRTFKGCDFLELYQDQDQPHIFFTYSYWQHEDDLEKYRSSELFKEVWAKTKALFSETPEAWSLTKKVTLA